MNEHHDVIDILDSFRWMSFCNICLHLLRCPLSTTEYRKLIDITSKLRVSDERVMRFISTSLQKASTWKSKVKKFMKASIITTTGVAGDVTTSIKKVDTLKLTQYVIEGIHSLTHSLTYSLTHSLTYLLTHLLTHSLTHSLTHLLTHSRINNTIQFEVEDVTTCYT